MNHKSQFAGGLRVANFSSIELKVDHHLEFDSWDVVNIVKKIRRYADLPYVFVVSGEQAGLVTEVLARLEGMRSPCYPYALFLADGSQWDYVHPDLEVIRLADADAPGIANRIADYASTRFRLDPDALRIGSSAEPPRKVDVVVIGAGITGLYAANRLLQSGIAVCVLEKKNQVGGIWSLYANATSRVNSSEGAYRLIKPRARTNRDHSSTLEILQDVSILAKTVSGNLFLRCQVGHIARSGHGYQVRFTREGKSGVVETKGVILAVNDRVGMPRKIQFPGMEQFKGKIVSGFSGAVDGLDWRDKRVVIVGMGAFAVENVRTALEGGARHVTVVGRRHGTVCPKIIDYLNFTTPYDHTFRHDRKSNIRNMVYWKKVYELSGATQPECWMGKVKHDGHTISVSDIWFVGHYLKKIETVCGQITGATSRAVAVGDHRRIDADILVSCIGFDRNTSLAKSLCDYEQMHNINYVDRDFMYLADAHIDDNAFNSFFGSSVLEMVKFYLEVFLRFFDKPGFADMLRTRGIEKIAIDDRKWSHYIAGAEALTGAYPDLYAAARNQVGQRTGNFIQKHDLKTYIAENKREWIDLHVMLADKPLVEADCLPYVFDKLLLVK